MSIRPTQSWDVHIEVTPGACRNQLRRVAPRMLVSACRSPSNLVRCSSVSGCVNVRKSRRSALATFKTGCAPLNIGGDTFFGIFALEQELLEFTLDRQALGERHFRAGLH